MRLLGWLRPIYSGGKPPIYFMWREWRYRVRRALAAAFNWLQGCRFFWVPTPGSPDGGYIDMTEKCCPYPLRFDWSVKACVKAGDCGCIKGLTREPQGERSNG